MASSNDLVRHRLINHRLAGSTLRDPRDVVAWFGAVQAQDFPGAKWALGLRAKGSTETVVDEAFNAGAIVRTHVLRPTWHLVAAADIRWLLALTGPRILARMAPRHRQLELDDAAVAKSGRALERSLSDAERSRHELAAALERVGIRITPERLSHLLAIAELQGRICSGPLRGGRITYALMDRRVPAAAPLPREEALALLAERYFRSHGPAALADFCWWSGLTAGDAKAAVAAAGSTLSQGSPAAGAYRHSGGPRRARLLQPAAWLLPNFDEYLVAYRDRSAVLGRVPIDPRDALGSTVILDGRAVGTWRALRGKDSAIVSIAPWRRLSGDERDRIAPAAARYGAFLGRPITVEQRPRTWRGRVAARGARE